MTIENNHKDCVDERKRGDRTCIECFYSQVNLKNEWMGDERCWNAQCLVAREDK